METFSVLQGICGIRRENYSHIEDEEASQLFEKSENDQRDPNLSQCSLGTKSWILLTGLNTLLLCITIFTVVVAIPRTSRLTDAEAIKRTHSYPPVFESSIPYLTSITLNGSLFNYPPRLNRNNPSSAMDAEWERLSDPGWILISREDVLALGKDPLTRARASPTLLEAMGKQPDAEVYIAQIDAFHQVHCLNAIRQHAYWDVYLRADYGAYDDNTPDNMHWTHLSQCFDMLYQNLACTASPDIITGIWMEGQQHPMPDFDVRKQCGNIDALLEWSYAHEVPRELEHLMKLPSAEEVGTLSPAPLELFRALGEAYLKGVVVDHEVPDRRYYYSSW